MNISSNEPRADGPSALRWAAHRITNFSGVRFGANQVQFIAEPSPLSGVANGLITEDSTMNRRTPARRVVAENRQWHLPLPEEEAAQGFRGWHTRGYLPHFDKPGLVQMITYRLRDAMPRDKRSEWEAMLSLKDEREKFIKIEAYLDAGHGSCLCRRPDVAEIVEDNLLHGDGDRYRLLAWVIMPNHVHVLIEVTRLPLDKVVHGWKSYTAHRIARVRGIGGAVWQPDYFDRYIRNEEHFHRAVRYIERNPAKAGMVDNAEDWRWSSLHQRARLESGEPVYRPETNPINRRDEHQR